VTIGQLAQISCQIVQAGVRATDDEAEVRGTACWPCAWQQQQWLPHGSSSTSSFVTHPVLLASACSGLQLSVGVAGKPTVAVQQQTSSPCAYICGPLNGAADACVLHSHLCSPLPCCISLFCCCCCCCSCTSCWT
jgi:hypothetical protein